MKTKKNIVVTVLTLLASSLMLIVVPSNASADSSICVSQNWSSCAEWKIYDANGIEKNSIVGPGSSGALADICGSDLCGGGSGGYAVQTRTISVDQQAIQAKQDQAVAEAARLAALPPATDSKPCSSENPCMTYAEVSSSGNVENIVVCQPSVCGSGDQVAITSGNRLVPQVLANPETHDTTGTGGQRSSGSRKVTLTQDDVFVITDVSPVTQESITVGAFIVPEVLVNSDNSKTITELSVNFGSFTNADLAVISANERVVNSAGAILSIANELAVLVERITQTDFSNRFYGSDYRIIQSKINRMNRLMRTWFL
jgi:hypothetical protein